MSGKVLPQFKARHGCLGCGLVWLRWADWAYAALISVSSGLISCLIRCSTTKAKGKAKTLSKGCQLADCLDWPLCWEVLLSDLMSRVVWSKPLESPSLYPVPQLWLHPSERELLGPPSKSHQLQTIRGFSSPASPVLTGQRWVLSRATKLWPESESSFQLPPFQDLWIINEPSVCNAGLSASSKLNYWGIYLIINIFSECFHCCFL